MFFSSLTIKSKMSHGKNPLRKNNVLKFYSFLSSWKIKQIFEQFFKQCSRTTRTIVLNTFISELIDRDKELRVS